MSLIKVKKIQTSYNHCVLVESIYSLALYGYINQNSFDNTLVILGDNIGYAEVVALLPNCIVYDCRKMARLMGNFCTRALASQGLYWRELTELGAMLNNAQYFYGHDHLPASYLLRSKAMTLLEDGVGNYNQPKAIAAWKRVKKRLFYKKALLFGYDSPQDNIYLTGLLPLPRGFKAKVTLLDRAAFIQSLFTSHAGLFAPAIANAERKSLLLTQPFSESAILSERQKIALYQSMVTKYQLTHLVIKPHPRETTDYSAVKFDCQTLEVIKPYTLAETLLRFQFEKLVTYNSSAVNQFVGNGTSVIIEDPSFSKIPG